MNTYLALKREFNRNSSNQYRSQIQSEKEGGILKAAKGEAIDYRGETTSETYKNPDRVKSDVNISKLRENYKKA